MKMTTAEKLAIMEAAHAAQRVYREVLDQAHADIGAAIQEMPEGTQFTPKEIASAAGVCYQVLPFRHTNQEQALRWGTKKSTKKYAAILPDGSVDLGQTIKVTRTSVVYTRTNRAPSKLGNSPGYDPSHKADPSEILDFLASIQPKE